MSKKESSNSVIIHALYMVVPHSEDVAPFATYSELEAANYAHASKVDCLIYLNALVAHIQPKKTKRRKK